MTVGPDGALYVIEYAASDFQWSGSTRINRIEYTGACRPATPVPPELPGTAIAARAPGLIQPRIGGRRHLRLPAAAAGFSLFDIRGALVWRYRRGGGARQASGDEDILLPGNLPRGALMVRMDFR